MNIKHYKILDCKRSDFIFMKMKYEDANYIVRPLYIINIQREECYGSGLIKLVAESYGIHYSKNNCYYCNKTIHYIEKIIICNRYKPYPKLESESDNPGRTFLSIGKWAFKNDCKWVRNIKRVNFEFLTKTCIYSAVA